MSGPFKMKGNPIQRNFGVGSPLHADKTVKVKTVDVSGGDKTKSEREKFEAMKKAPGTPSDKLKSQYGGTWAKKGGTYKNEQGLSAAQAARSLSRQKNKEKKEYLKNN